MTVFQLNCTPVLAANSTCLSFIALACRNSLHIFNSSFFYTEIAVIKKAFNILQWSPHSALLAAIASTEVFFWEDEKSSEKSVERQVERQVEKLVERQVEKPFQKSAEKIKTTAAITGFAFSPSLETNALIATMDGILSMWNFVDKTAGAMLCDCSTSSFAYAQYNEIRVWRDNEISIKKHDKTIRHIYFLADDKLGFMDEKWSFYCDSSLLFTFPHEIVQIVKENNLMYFVDQQAHSFVYEGGIIKEMEENCNLITFSVRSELVFINKNVLEIKDGNSAVFQTISSNKARIPSAIIKELCACAIKVLDYKCYSQYISIEVESFSLDNIVLFVSTDYPSNGSIISFKLYCRAISSKDLLQAEKTLNELANQEKVNRIQKALNYLQIIQDEWQNKQSLAGNEKEEDFTKAEFLMLQIPFPPICMARFTGNGQLIMIFPMKNLVSKPRSYEVYRHVLKISHENERVKNTSISIVSFDEKLKMFFEKISLYNLDSYSNNIAKVLYNGSVFSALNILHIQYDQF